MQHTISVAAFRLAAFCFLAPLAAAEGTLSRLDAQGRPAAPCPLEHTAVTAEAQGPVVRVKVRQIFHNPTADPLEAVYVFPLAAGGSVDAMTLRIGDRVVHGQIKSTAEARAIYDAARRTGKLAGLLDQSRPNVFIQRVANIPPNAKVDVEIQYLETLRFEAGRYEFVFPMTVGPRYSPRHDPGAFRNPDYAARGTRAGHDLSLSMKLDAGLPVDSIDSTTHEIVIENRTASGAFVKLRNQKEIPNKDFILRWDVAGRKMNDALLTHRGRDGKGYFSFVLAPPEQPAREDVTPKELVFVIDTSGSMHGFPLDKAKEAMTAAIDELNPRDRFNLITFSGDTHVLFPAPVAASAENIALAKSFLAGRRSGGGTEMMKAVRAALAPSESREHVRIVCFMTDGYVGNEEEILAEVRRHPQARIFAFGIGSSVNRYLLDQMSLQGRGEVEYVGLQDDGSAAAKRFHARVRTPLLTDIQIGFNGLPVEEVYPQRIPDLFSAKPVVITGRYRAAARGSLRISGRMGGRTFERTISVDLSATIERRCIRSLWARAKAAALTADGASRNREALTALGLEFGLVTPFTSFVAVEEQTRSEGGTLRTVEVPVEMPEGVAARTAEVAPVRMAMPLGITGELRHRANDVPPTPAAPKLAPEIDALMGSTTQVGVRVYLTGTTDDVLARLKAAGLRVIARPGNANLVIGEIQGTKLPALAALPYVKWIAPR